MGIGISLTKVNSAFLSSGCSASVLFMEGMEGRNAANMTTERSARMRQAGRYRRGCGHYPAGRPASVGLRPIFTLMKSMPGALANLPADHRHFVRYVQMMIGDPRRQG